MATYESIFRKHSIIGHDKPHRSKFIDNTYKRFELVEKINGKKDNKFTSVSLLQNRGIPPNEIEKLKAAGYHTIESIAFTRLGTLISIKGLNESNVVKIKKEAMNLVPIKFTTATEIQKQRAEKIFITTGSKTLDGILGGGIESGSITALYGDFKSGKSQMCHTLAVTCRLSVERGGADGRAIYIDTGDNFRPERLIDIAKRFKMDESYILDQVAIARARNSHHQTELLVQAAAMMTESKYALLIVDSCTHLFRTDYQGRGQLAARQIHLARFLRILARLASEFGVAVVVTNEVTANFENEIDFENPNQVKFVGGNIMAHGVTTTLFLRQDEKGGRICKVDNSPCLPEREAKFKINQNGIEDYADVVDTNTDEN